MFLASQGKLLLLGPRLSLEAEGLIQNTMKKCLQGFEGEAGTEYAGKTGLLGQEQLRDGSVAKPIKPSLASH